MKQISRKYTKRTRIGLILKHGQSLPMKKKDHLVSMMSWIVELYEALDSAIIGTSQDLNGNVSRIRSYMGVTDTFPVQERTLKIENEAIGYAHI